MYPDIHMEKAPAPSRLWSMNPSVWHTFQVDTLIVLADSMLLGGITGWVPLMLKARSLCYMVAEGYRRLSSSLYGGITGGLMASGQKSSNSIGNLPWSSWMTLVIPSKIGPLGYCTSVPLLHGRWSRDPKLVLIKWGCSWITPWAIFIAIHRTGNTSCRPWAVGEPRLFGSYLVDPASSHMLVSKIKPCMSKYKQLYGETANGSLNQL
jgi:hypothetical protein